MTRNERGVLDKVFPVTISAEQLGDFDPTLGIEDSSGGRATRLLHELPREAVELIHRFAHLGVVDPLEFADHIRVAIEGLDRIDPKRQRPTAIELVLKEIECVKAYRKLARGNRELPIVTWVQDETLLSPDTARPIWMVMKTHSWRKRALLLLDDIDVAQGYTEDPNTYRSAYHTSEIDIITYAYA